MEACETGTEKVEPKTWARIVYCKGVLRTQSNIYDGDFLRNQSMAETRDLFSQKGSIVDVQLTSKFVSEQFFLFSPFFSQEMKKHSMPHCSYL